MKKIGLLAYSSNTGLGHQTLEFYNYMKPHKTLVVDLSPYNAMPTHHDRYPDSRICRGIPRQEDMDWLLNDVEIVFECETPLSYYLHKRAKELGVKIVQQYNYEFLDYFKHPEYTAPAVLAAPSNWNTHLVAALNIAPVRMLPVPTNRKLIPFRDIHECKTFAHIIGRPAYMDRNGTLAFLEAASIIGNKFKYIVYYQEPKDDRAVEYFKPVKDKLEELKQTLNIDVRIDTPNYNEMFTEGDVLVLPRRYGGLCLPMQESLSAGMPVIMTDISPNNSRLPSEWLVRATRTGEFEFHAKVDVYSAHVDHLVEVMLRFENPMFTRNANMNADAIADLYSWESMVNFYNKFFESI